MKVILLPLITILWYSGLWAQITITKATFPKVGDTLKMGYDGAPTGVNLSAKGADRIWDFSKLQGLTHNYTLSSLPAKASPMSLPKASMTLTAQNSKKYYLHISNSKIEYYGMKGKDPLGLGINTLQTFSPPLIERRAPIDFKDKKSSKSNSVLSFSNDDLPRRLINSLPLKPDSVRFRIKMQREDVVDAWGILTIPGGTYEVLREKRTTIKETFIDAKISPLPWLDMSNVVGDLLPMLRKDTTVDYYFFALEEVEPIAIVQAHPSTNKAIAVEYKANDAQNNIKYINQGKADLLVYPNPAIEDVRFEFLNLPKGKYSLTIYNILGVVVWEKDYAISGHKTAKVDLTDFRKGTYLYSLTNDKGKTITTKRLIILRP